MMSVSIILPVIDELENLKILIPYFIENLDHIKLEIIVIEDLRSNSDTEDYLSTFDGVKYVRGNDEGLTAAIKLGISLANHELIYWSDADLSHPPEMIHKMLLEIELGHDVIVCSRFENESQDHTHEGSAFIYFHKILSRLLSLLGQIFLVRGFKDYSSGFILVKKSVLTKVKFSGDYGEYFMELIYKSYLKKYKLKEVPFISPKRMYGHSKTATNFNQLFSRGYKYLLKILELRGEF